MQHDVNNLYDVLEQTEWQMHIQYVVAFKLTLLICCKSAINYSAEELQHFPIS